MARNHAFSALCCAACLVAATTRAEPAEPLAPYRGASPEFDGGFVAGRPLAWLRSSPPRHFTGRPRGDLLSPDTSSIASHGVLRIRLSDPRDPRSALGSFIIGPAGVVYLLEFE